MSEKRSIDELAEDVRQADISLKGAEDRESFARSEATACRNRLNEAQKAFDKAVAEFRSKAPRSSDWGTAAREVERR